MVNKTSKQSRFQQVEIGKIEGRRCVLEAIPEAMTAFAGAPMIAEMEKSTELIKELSKRVSDSRALNRLRHTSTNDKRPGLKVPAGLKTAKQCVIAKNGSLGEAAIHFLMQTRSNKSI